MEDPCEVRGDLGTEIVFQRLRVLPEAGENDAGVSCDLEALQAVIGGLKV